MRTRFFWAAALCLLCVSCDDGDRKKSECAYQGTRCTEDGAYVTTCRDGEEFRDPCTAGCEGGVCKGSCAYTGTQCRGGALYTCNAGKETKTKDCECASATECKSSGTGCSYTGTQCRSDALYSCSGGQETKLKDCTCASTTECETSAADCDYSGKKCSDDYDAVLRCDSGTESVVKECGETEYCDPEELDCLDLGETHVCDAGAGPACLGEKTAIRCKSDGSIEIVEECIEGCTDGECDAVSCPATMSPSCFDRKTKLECDSTSNTMKKTPCGDGEVCNRGVCSSGSSTVDCDFVRKCADDHSGVLSCNKGTITFEHCPVKQYCSDTDADGNPTAISCKSAMISESQNICDPAHFVDACDGKTAYRCDPTASGTVGTLNTQFCTGQQECVEGICRTTSTNKKIGDTCNVQYFDPVCIGSQPVKCEKNNANEYVVTADGPDCSTNGGVCGVILMDGAPHADCFEPCNNPGATISECWDMGGNWAEAPQQCVSIGNGKYGLDHINAHTTECGTGGCTQGHCVDYTAGIENVCGVCSRTGNGAFTDYCKDSSRAVSCELDVNDDCGHGQSEYSVLVELCDYDEVCAVFPWEDGTQKADCLKQCDANKAQAGAEGHTIWDCEAGTHFSTLHSSECVKIGNSYVYKPNDAQLCNSCSDGKCK